MKNYPIWRLIIFFLIFKLVLLFFVINCRGFLPFSNIDYEQNSDHFHGQTQSDLEKGLSPFDGPQYLNIAYSGYQKMAAEDSKIYAFFPLYPLLIKMFSYATAGNYTLAGLLVSFLAHLLSVVLFYRLILLDDSEDVAMNSVKYSLIFPTAIFFIAVYTEALFFFLTIATFYLARKRKWWLAGLSGLLAAMTRPPGIILLVPFLIEYYLYLKELKIQSFLDFLKKTRANILSFILIPMGVFIYFLYVYLLTGDFFFYFKALSYWSRSKMSVTNVFTTLYDKLVNFNQLPLHSFYSSKVDVIATLFFIGLLIYAFKKIRFSYWVYGMMLIALPLSSGQTMSLSRYLSVVFPGFIILGILGKKNEFWDFMITLVFILLLSFFSLSFVNWYWVG
jgi:hypothetical protein